jgi:hypothetical protein
MMHAALDDGMLDTEKFSDTCLHAARVERFRGGCPAMHMQEKFDGQPLM